MQRLPVLVALVLSAGCRSVDAPIPTADAAQRAEWERSYEEFSRVAGQNAVRRSEIARGGGLEMGDAGFHLTLPSRMDWKESQAFPGPLEDSAGEWVFWDVLPHHLAVEARAEPWQHASEWIPVSCRRIPIASAIEVGVRWDTATGTYSLSALFDERGLECLRSLVAPLSTGPNGWTYDDWFGIERRNGLEPTELRVVLVADDHAHGTISVTDILREVDCSERPRDEVVIAAGLRESQAEDLAARLRAQR